MHESSHRNATERRTAPRLSLPLVTGMLRLAPNSADFTCTRAQYSTEADKPCKGANDAATHVRRHVVRSLGVVAVLHGLGHQPVQSVLHVALHVPAKQS